MAEAISGAGLTAVGFSTATSLIAFARRSASIGFGGNANSDLTAAETADYIAKTHKLVGGDNRYNIHIRKYRDQLAVPADREGKPTPQQFCGFHEPCKEPSGLDNGVILDSLSRARARQLPALNNHGPGSGPSHLDSSLP
jgi:hypothetical protein